MLKKIINHTSGQPVEMTLNLDGFPGFNIGDLIEISPGDRQVPEEDRLILRVPVPQSPSGAINPGMIYIDTHIAKSFGLISRTTVNVTKVDPDKVTIDSLEVMFKHQYLSRSVMWRMKSHLVGESVYLNKPVTFAGIHCSVFEMWRAGVKTSSGVIGPHTKIVFRSASSQIFIFLQMSSEMWDFDINGDLYFEKAVNGFLADLFKKWNQLKCIHDVTIVLFSRTYYKADDISQFPSRMRTGLQKDWRGRIYEDFYRVVVQNERFESWTPILSLLMQLFNQYEREVVRYHETEASGIDSESNLRIPKAYNSTASQGNFLEVLNISLNVFDKHNVDRSFDRTGQLSIVISPGVGVFEVEFDLTNLTKQRIIDNGIGSDLVCLGEQPLHAVPLFKYHCKKDPDSNSYTLDAADVYNMPHWINLSFYTTPVPPGPSSFIPRIKLPKTATRSTNGYTGAKCPLKSLYARSQSRDQVTGKTVTGNGAVHSSVINGKSQVTNGNNYHANGRGNSNVIASIDYDNYDDNIFKPTSAGKYSTTVGITGPSNQRRKSVVNDRHSLTGCDKSQIYDRSASEANVEADDIITEYRSNRAASSSAMLVPSSRQRASSPVQVSSSFRNTSSIIPSPLADCSLSSSCFSYGSYPPSCHTLPKCHAFDDLTLCANTPRANRSGHRPKALINPFDPSQITIKLTSNRRRWTHVFPKDANGIFMQQHHYKAVPAVATTATSSTVGNDGTLDHNETIMVPVTATPTQIRKASTSASNKNTTSSRTVDELGKNTRASPRNSTADDRYAAGARMTSRPVETRSSDTMTYAWGATGEQEWTPAITTTMDWKSLVMPACLPITTDFFPDAMSLQNDYYTAQYTLLPVDQGSELMKFVCYRGGDDLRNHKAINVQQVLEELTCQRLQQGFQLILLPQSIKNFGVKSDNNLGKTEYTMSIGNIFHRLHIPRDASAASIVVTQFKPKHPYPSITIEYRYQFRAPDNQTFGVSLVDFVPERLENYKWNHLDNYICMRGEGDNDLEESLKFWRFRLLLLPNIQQSITARLTECDDTGQQQLRCLGAYKETNHDDRMLLFTGFINFFAMISKFNELPFKKSSTPLTPRNVTQTSPMPKIDRKRYSLPSPNSSARLPNLAPKSPKGKETTGNVLEMDQIDLKVPSPNLSPKTEKHMDTFDKCKISLVRKGEKMALPSLDEIAQMLKGCSFIIHNQKGLLPYSFISASAILWTIETFIGIESEVEAMALLQSMHGKKLICHASGDETMPFICGFFLYHVVSEVKHSRVDIRMFQKDWMQCEMCLKEVTNNEEEAVLHNSHEWYKELSFNQAILDLSPSAPKNERHERVEWVHLRYHSRYDPGQAFGIDLDWLVATGHQIADIVSNWTHKAATYKLHLVPIPNDPFALPSSGTSDPLRGPIFIDLNLAALPDDLKDENIIVQFREKILSKWGFLPYLEPQLNYIQYVHVSGSIFVMIPRDSDRSAPSPKADVETTHENYISKHFIKSKPDDDDAKQVPYYQSGFLWSWNYMITKRWKSKATGDEVFMKRVMEDFKQFCSNSKNRLHEFYLEQFKGKNLSTSSDSSHSSLSDLSNNK